jgi:hypothetical protein
VAYYFNSGGSTTSAIWNEWTITGTNTTTATSTGSGIWQGWNQPTYTTSTATVIWRMWTTTATGISNYVDQSWRAWNTTGAGGVVGVGGYVNQRILDTRTPEQIAAEKKRAAKLQKEYNERERKARIQRRQKSLRIRRTAEAMLLSLLTDEQAREWKRRKAIRHVGRAGIFEINPAFGGELYLLDHAGKAKDKFCVHASRAFPMEDRAAALLLALRADEDVVLQRANRNGWIDDHEKRRLELGRIRMKEDAYALN